MYSKGTGPAIELLGDSFATIDEEDRGRMLLGFQISKQEDGSDRRHIKHFAPKGYKAGAVSSVTSARPPPHRFSCFAVPIIYQYKG